MGYRCRIFDSLETLDAEAWDSVCRQAGASTFLDRQFFAAVASGMKDESRFWLAIVSDEAGRPVACAALSTMTINVADFMNPKLPWVLRKAPGILPPLNVLICGLPGAPGEKNLAVAPQSDGRQIIDALDAALSRLAEENRMVAVIYREFTPADLDVMNGLGDRGYSRAEIPQMYMLNRPFADFEAYRSALRRNYRREVSRSRKKMTDAGVRAVVLSTTEDMLRAYTPAAHGLYADVVSRAAIKQAPLPMAYFVELAQRLPGAVELVMLKRDSEVLAIGWCLRDRAAYHFMYAGFDYTLNREFDLYFNLVFACIERAFQLGVERIHVGQASSFFKARIGCEPEGRYVYVKGFGLIMSRVARYLSGRLVPNDELSVAPTQSFKAASGDERESAATDARVEREQARVE